jgi:hypothetical protein
VDETLSVKLPRQTKTRLRAVVRSRRTTPSALLRKALELVVAGDLSGPPSLYELSRDLFEDSGRGGARDLSTNPRYLRDLGK